MHVIGLFCRVAVVAVALVIAAMMALSAFNIELPIYSVTTTTVGDTTVTTKCTWLHSPDSTGCTTTRTHHSK